MKLQELVFRIGGARMPIVDKQFSRVPWGKIHITRDHHPATQREHPFESHNPPKQIIIAGGGTDVDGAVSAFTEATLGVPLKSLEDNGHKWESRKVVAIPEKMETIYGSSPKQKKSP